MVLAIALPVALVKTKLGFLNISCSDRSITWPGRSLVDTGQELHWIATSMGRVVKIIMVLLKTCCSLYFF